MKKDDFFSELNSELDRIVPEMSDKVKNEPIISRASEKEKKDNAIPAKAVNSIDGAENIHSNDKIKKPFAERAKIFFRKYGFKVASVAASFAVVMAIIFSTVIFPVSNAPDFTVMQVDINPSISLVLDKNYLVTAVYSNNSDGDVLIEDRQFADSLVGLDAKEAGVRISERAAVSGFIRADNKGTVNNYNAVNVTLTGDGDISDSVAKGISSDITQYFMQEGIYVYSDCIIKEQKTDNLSETFGEGYFLYSRISAEELETYAENAVYAYANELLYDAITRYDLYEEIYTSNERIKELTGGKTFWDIDDNLEGESGSLYNETENAVKKLDMIYGVKINSYADFVVKYTAYQAGIVLVDVEELKVLLEEGINAENFGGIENIGVRMNYYDFVANELFHSIIEDLFDGSTETVDRLTESVSSIAAMRLESRLARFSAIFEIERKPITQSEYDMFLSRIQMD